MSSKSETRLTEIEGRLAHYERASDDISAVLAEQGRLVDELKQRLARLTDRVAALEAGAAPADDRPPPHY